MFGRIFTREWKSRQLATFVYAGIGLLLLLLYTALFPSLQKSAQNFQQLLNSYPKSFLKAFNVDTSFFSSAPSYLAGEMYSLTWQVLVILLALSRAGQAIANEIEQGTISYLLMLPISRLRLYIGKYLSGLAAIVLFVVATILVEIPIAAAFSLHYPIKNTLLFAGLGLLFTWAIFAVSYAVSALVNERSKLYFSVGGLIVIMYVLDTIAKLKTNLAWIGRVSIFHYFDVNRFLVQGQVVWTNLLVLGGLVVIGTIIGAIIFLRRDIAA